MTDGPVLTTARRLLRPPIKDDFEPLFAFMTDADASCYVGGPQPRAVVWRKLAAGAGSWALSGFGMFSVVKRNTGRWIGRAGPLQPEGWTEFIHAINPKNVVSVALAVKLGSVNRGPGQLPPPLADEAIEIWGQTAAQWRQRTAGLESKRKPSR